MVPAIILFAITYVLILAFGKYRTYIALASGVIFIATGMLPLASVPSAIDFNVILMIIGTMGLVSLFTESKMPAMLADMIMMRALPWSGISSSICPLRRPSTGWSSIIILWKAFRSDGLLT